MYEAVVEDFDSLKGIIDFMVDGGPISLRSYRMLRPGGRLVVSARYSTLSDGHKN
jgi:hypothetical protein